MVEEESRGKPLSDVMSFRVIFPVCVIVVDRGVAVPVFFTSIPFRNVKLYHIQVFSSTSKFLPNRHFSSYRTLRLNTNIMNIKTPIKMLYVSKTNSMVSFVLNVEIISNIQEIPMTVKSFKFIMNLKYKICLARIYLNWKIFGFIYCIVWGVKNKTKMCPKNVWGTIHEHCPWYNELSSFCWCTRFVDSTLHSMNFIFYTTATNGRHDK